ncbi:MAG: LysR substrate-binding domain-containing protein [Steroidobacteraceae bacterium]
MKRDVDLRALRAFRSIVRTGTVTAAGRELGLTQPATSRLLAQLERSLGFELFHRDRGRLVPTSDALLLFEEVEVALGGIDHVQGLVADIAQFRVGRLRLVAPPSFTEGVLPDIAAAFLARFPDVHLSIDSRSVETARKLIATRAVDAGFVRMPIDRTDLAAETVVVSTSVCVLPSAHRLAREGELDPARLRGEALILLGAGRQSRMQIEAAFADAGIAPRVRIDTHTIGSACGLAARGVGVTIVNGLLARPYLRDSLVARPFRPEMRHEYAFVTAAVPGPTRLAREFLHETRAWFARANYPAPKVARAPSRRRR